MRWCILSQYRHVTSHDFEVVEAANRLPRVEGLKPTGLVYTVLLLYGFDATAPSPLYSPRYTPPSHRQWTTHYHLNRTLKICLDGCGLQP